MPDSFSVILCAIASLWEIYRSIFQLGTKTRRSGVHVSLANNLTQQPIRLLLQRPDIRHDLLQHILLHKQTDILEDSSNYSSIPSERRLFFSGITSMNDIICPYFWRIYKQVFLIAGIPACLWSQLFLGILSYRRHKLKRSEPC